MHRSRKSECGQRKNIADTYRYACTYSSRYSNTLCKNHSRNPRALSRSKLKSVHVGSSQTVATPHTRKGVRRANHHILANDGGTSLLEHLCLGATWMLYGYDGHDERGFSCLAHACHSLMGTMVQLTLLLCKTLSTRARERDSEAHATTSKQHPPTPCAADASFYWPRRVRPVIFGTLEIIPALSSCLTRRLDLVVQHPPQSYGGGSTRTTLVFVKTG